MPKPNVNVRNREVGWVGGVIFGNGGAISHGTRGNLTPGFPQDTFPHQVNHAILGGASSIFIDTLPLAQILVPSTRITGVRDTHCVYLEIQAHLRSAGNVDLPASVRIFCNELPAADFTLLGDWTLNGWQEWEQYSPIMIPTPPPGFTGGGAGGIRYVHRRRLGQVPSNIFFLEIANLGSVAATEWSLEYYLRNQEPVVL